MSQDQVNSNVCCSFCDAVGTIRLSAMGEAICVDCGAVNEDADLVPEETFLSTQGTFEEQRKVAGNRNVVLGNVYENLHMKVASTQSQSFKFNSITRHKFSANSQVMRLCLEMQLSKSDLNQVRNLFNEFRSAPGYMPSGIDVTAAACIYMVSRMNGLPHTLENICKRFNVDLYNAGKVFKRVQQMFQPEIKEIPRLQMLTQLISTMEPDPAIACNIIKWAEKILNLISFEKLFEGKKTTPVLMAIGILAKEIWQSKIMKKSDFNKCCTICEAIPSTVHQRYIELKDVLIKECKRCPWASDVTDKTFFCSAQLYLDYLHSMKQISVISSPVAVEPARLDTSVGLVKGDSIGEIAGKSRAKRLGAAKVRLENSASAKFSESNQNLVIHEDCDAEDYMIETLLLHNVNEKTILESSKPELTQMYNDLIKQEDEKESLDHSVRRDGEKLKEDKQKQPDKITVKRVKIDDISK